MHPPPDARAETGGLAATARSILACPDGAALVVDGVDDVLAGIDEGDEGDGGGGLGGVDRDPARGLGLQDLGGRPTLSCPPGVPLATAARAGAEALLTLTSGVGPRGGPERDAVLTLGGALRSTGTDDCACCAEVREVLVLEVSLVMLARGDAEPRRVSPDEFASAAHRLNRGFLQRSVEHANLGHQEELRRMVADTTGTRLLDIGGVALRDLRPDQVEVAWVTAAGAHRRVVRFPTTASTPEALGELLRHELLGGQS